MLVGERTARRVGAGILCLGLVLAVATMLLAGYSVAPGFILHVDFERISNLKPGGKVMMCGRDVGEIVGIRLAPRASFLQRRDPAEPEEARLTLDLWLRLKYQKHIHRNSEFFVNQLGLLGEQYLEIGAPRGEPGPTVSWGDHLRGVDPPRVDRLLAQTHRTLQSVTELLRELRPFGREIVQALEALRAVGRAAGLDGPAALQLVERVAATIDEGRALYATLEHGTNKGADLTALREELGRLGDRVGDDLRLIGRQLDRVMARLESAKEIWAPERRARVERAFTTLKRVVAIGEALARDARAIIAMVERGDGTVGGFMHDRELWDDFHYVHKVLKDKPWSVIVKPRRPGRE